MPASDLPLGASSEPQRRELALLLAECERGWEEGGLAAAVARIGPDSALRRPALVECVKIDLGRRWRRGRGPALEEYLELYPELGTAQTVAPELVYAEYEARSRWGGGADLEEFVRRFPRQADALRSLVAQSTAPAGPGAESGGEVSTGPADTPLPRAGQPPLGPFGRYRLLQTLGQGGMGAVYLAHDGQLDRRVALKVPHLGAAEGEWLERFYREARAAATLDHPNICPVYDIGTVDGVPYLTMACIEGEPLSHKLRRDGPWREVDAASLIRDLALALGEAHRRGVIHRDLKPANIMLRSSGVPVIMDFGLARRMGLAASPGEIEEVPTGGEDERLTRVGQVMGTPAYMPPEQVSGDHEAMGPGCDVYSLGVILYELLTGRPPFQGKVAAILDQIVSQDPPPPSTFRKGLDARLEAVCLKALARRVEDRFGTMSELAEALNDYLRRVERRRRRALALLLGGAAVVGVLLVVLGWRFGWSARGGEARAEALAARAGAEAARQQAQQARAPVEAAPFWDAAERKAESAEGHFAAGEHPEARKAWREAVLGYDTAREAVTGLPRVRTARAAFEAEVKKHDPVRLEAEAGPAWRKALEAREAAERAAEGGRFRAAEERYGEARNRVAEAARLAELPRRHILAFDVGVELGGLLIARIVSPTAEKAAEKEAYRTYIEETQTRLKGKFERLGLADAVTRDALQETAWTAAKVQKMRENLRSQVDRAAGRPLGATFQVGFELAWLMGGLEAELKSPGAVKRSAFADFVSRAREAAYDAGHPQEMIDALNKILAWVDAGSLKEARQFIEKFLSRVSDDTEGLQFFRQPRAVRPK